MKKELVSLHLEVYPIDLKYWPLFEIWAKRRAAMLDQRDCDVHVIREYACGKCGAVLEPTPYCGRCGEVVEE